MVTILKALINSPELLAQTSSELFSSQEQSYLKFISESYSNSGEYPSVELLSHQFPELRFDDEPPLSESDARVYISNFLKKRENLKQSQLLMQLASQVAEFGITSDVIDQLSGQTIQSSDHEDTIGTLEAYKNYYDLKTQKFEGIKTNIKAIDDAIGALPPGTCMTVAGYTSHGKSLLANNMVYYNATQPESMANFCILSLEVPKEQLLANLLVRHSQNTDFSQFPKFTPQQIDRGKLTQDQYDFVFNTLYPDLMDTSKHGKIVVYDESDITDTKMSTMKDLIIRADDLCRKETGAGLDCVVVDHVQLLKFDSGASKKSDMEVINQAVSFFHKLAQNFRVIDGNVQQMSVVLLSQINRDGYKKAIKSRGAYNLTCLADANELERASQTIMTIWLDQEGKMAKEARVCLLKNRSGECITDPETVFCDPAHYVIGDGLSDGFSDQIEMDGLEDVFGGAGFEDLFG